MIRNCPQCRLPITWVRRLSLSRWVCEQCDEVIERHVPAGAMVISLLPIPVTIGLTIYLAPIKMTWIPLVIMGTLTPALWIGLERARVTELPGIRCAHCGYDLRGLPLNDHGNAVCPECSQEDWL